VRCPRPGQRHAGESRSGPVSRESRASAAFDRPAARQHTASAAPLDRDAARAPAGAGGARAAVGALAEPRAGRAAAGGRRGAAPRAHQRRPLPDPRQQVASPARLRRARAATPLTGRARRRRPRRAPGSPRLAHCLPAALRATWTRDAALPGRRVPDAGAQLAAALAAPAELEALFRLAARPSRACLAAASPQVLLGALEGPGGAHHAAVDWAVDAGGFCACLEALGALQVSRAPLREETRWRLRTQPLDALGVADTVFRYGGRDETCPVSTGSV